MRYKFWISHYSLLFFKKIQVQVTNVSKILLLFRYQILDFYVRKPHYLIYKKIY